MISFFGMQRTSTCSSFALYIYGSTLGPRGWNITLACFWRMAPDVRSLVRSVTASGNYPRAQGSTRLTSFSQQVLVGRKARGRPLGLKFLLKGVALNLQRKAIGRQMTKVFGDC
jgi:hypothetical protein